MEHTELIKPETLDDLIKALHEKFSGDTVNVEEVQNLMESYESNPHEWMKYGKFDQFRYTRNLVDEGNGKFNLMILCWGEGHGSSIHDHTDSHCFLKLLQGQLKETLFDWPDNKVRQGMTKKSERILKENQCAYINAWLSCTGCKQDGVKMQGFGVAILTQVIWAQLLLLGWARASELTFELPDNAKQCFYEDIIAGTKCTLEFQVVTGGHYDVDCRLDDPDGTVLYKEMKKQYDSFTFTASKNGSYKFCFSNEFSTFTHKTVYFDFQVGEDPPLFPNENRVSALTQMESACVSIHEALKSVIDYQTHFRLREAQGRSRAEDLNTRVAFWSIGEAIILPADGAFPAVWRCLEDQQGVMDFVVFILSPTGYHRGRKRELQGGPKTYLCPLTREFIKGRVAGFRG
ncbi:TMED7 protein, partial [Polypterus senegalus]